MNILIVGGTGVLSSAVVSEAKRKGIEITMINRGRRNVPSGVRLVKSDKNDYTNIREAIKDELFTCVIDFLCYTDEETTQSVNFYSKYTDQYFFISSCAVYDKTIPGVKDENSPKPLTIWDYSINKYKSEEHLKEITSEIACNFTIIRPCVTYGDTRIPYGIMPPYGYHWTLCARILAGKPVIRWNGGTTRTNMMRVEDFAVGVIGLIGNEKAYNEAFNICGDEMPSFNDVLVALSKALNKEVVTVDMPSSFYADEIPYRRGELLGGRSIDALNSNDKIKRVVPKFAQTISLDEGVKMTIDAYRKQNYQKGIDWTFDADTDRIIKKWCKQQGINWQQYHLGFVDYLGTATFRDRKTYWMEFYKEEWFLITIIRCANKLKRIKGKVKRMIRKIA